MKYLHAKSYRARLAQKANGFARIQKIGLELQAIDKVMKIKAKATAFIANNPQGRALFLLG